MQKAHPNRHVYLWWGRWWAVQFFDHEWFSLGIHIEPRRPLVDLFVGPLTICFGNHPVLRDPRHKHRHSFPLFYMGDRPEDLVL